MHGKCMGYGARPQLHPSKAKLARIGSPSRASHLVFGTALCDVICGRPAVGRPFFGEAKLSTDAIRATSDGSGQAGRQVHSSRGSITSMANLFTANGDDDSRQRG